MDGWNVLLLKTRVDAFSIDELKVKLEDLIKSGSRNIALDLKATRFLSLQGIKLIVKEASTIKNAGGQLALIGPIEKTKRHFEIYGTLDDILVVRDESELPLVMNNMAMPDSSLASI